MAVPGLRTLKERPERLPPADWPSPDPALAGFGYEHDEAWSESVELFRHFTDVTRGVRRLGAAAVDLCYVAEGINDAYWEYRLKPWDVSATLALSSRALGVIKRCVWPHTPTELGAHVIRPRRSPAQMAAGVLVVEEAGGKVTTMDGSPFSVFDRSIIASNQGIYDEILAQTRPSVDKLRGMNVDLSRWFIPEGYEKQLDLE